MVISFRYTPVNPNLLYFYCFSNLLPLRFYIESLIFDIGLNCQTKFEHNNLKNCTSHIFYNGISKKGTSLSLLFSYAPNFDEVEEALVWAYPSVRYTCTLSRTLREIWYVGRKLRRHVFFLVDQICHCRIIALFKVFHFHYVLSLWKLVNKIS